MSRVGDGVNGDGFVDGNGGSNIGDKCGCI